MLFGEQLGGRHHRHLEAVLHGHHGGQERHDRLAGPHIALQQALHRPAALHVGDDVAHGFPLPRRQAERQHLTHPLPQGVVDGDDMGLLHRGVFAAPERQARLVDEEVFEDDAPLRGRGRHVQGLDRGAGIREVGLPERGAAIGPAVTGRHLGRHDVGQRLIEQGQRAMHQRAVHVGRDRTRLLVDRHDAAGVQWFALSVVLQYFVLGRGELQAATAPVLRAAEQHHFQVRLQHVLQEFLVRPHHLHLTAVVLDQGREQRKARPSRGGDAGRDDGAEDGGGAARTQRRDRLEPAAILVAARKADQEVFDRTQPGFLEIRGLARTDPFQELQLDLQGIVGHPRNSTE